MRFITAGKRRSESRSGFTLVEFMVAFAIVALILVGTFVIMRYLVVETSEGSDRTLAQLEVHYVASWIGEDVVQAGNITRGNSYAEFPGFPLTITWEGTNDGIRGNYTVTYDISGNVTENPWQLTREQKFKPEGSSEYTSLGQALVAEYLVPWSEDDGRPWEAGNGTRCERKIVDGVPENVLVLEVTAKVDTRWASSTYEISPRRSDVTWDWQI